MSRRAGLLGGTFDPIHSGHVDLGEAAQTALRLDALIVLPAHVPPHRPAPVASAYHRFAMAAIAVAGRDGWEVSDAELKDPGYSFTATTLRRFAGEGYSPHELFFIIGADAFADIQSWRDYPALLDLAHFAVVSRPGHPVMAMRQRLETLAARMIDAGDFEGEQAGTAIILIDATTADVSSTAIRERRTRGDAIDELMPPGVYQHIEQHRLYRSASADRRDAHRVTNPAAGRLHGQGSETP